MTTPTREYDATTRTFADVAFDLVGALEIQRLASDIPAEYIHRLPAGTRPNRHAAGPFCRFELLSSHSNEGVYAILVGPDLRYLGECADLSRRFGPLGYGHVSSRNCHHDGQATNCKINSKVLASAKAGQTVTVWFHSTSDRKALEARLISALSPPWNGTRHVGVAEARSHEPATPARYTAADDVFRRALRQFIHTAQCAGAGSVRVRSGDLHRTVGGYPGAGHRMPACCAVMRSEMTSGDVVVATPPKGSGANLLIEYLLPRPG